MGPALSKDSETFKRWWILVGIVAVYVLYQFGRFVIWKVRNIFNQSAAKTMLKDRNSQHYKFEKVGQDQTEIMKGADVTLLREHLMKGTFTSVDLVNYFGERCQRIGREMGYSTQELFTSGMELAKKCDKERAEALLNNSGDSLPFLHGIPCSIKELFSMRGKLSTVGVAMLNFPRSEDSEGWLPLTEAGAIPIVRGNVP